LARRQDLRPPAIAPILTGQPTSKCIHAHQPGANTMNPLSHIDPDDPYPESDGQPMADNTEQFEWIEDQENLNLFSKPGCLRRRRLLWYRCDRQITGPLAPDAMVASGGRGRRGCYKQWRKAACAAGRIRVLRRPTASGDARQAPSTTYRVEEYYVYDPERNTLEVWLRQDGSLRPVSHVGGWTSPRLGIRFALLPETMEIYDPAGQPFLTSVELARRARQEAARAALEHRRAERLAERLRAMGVDPDRLDDNP
jgi:hypothetical protein